MSDKTLKQEWDALKADILQALKFKKETLKFGEAMTSEGKTLTYEGEALAEGMPVMLDGGAAPDGAYTLDNGSVCNVKDGKVESIVAPQENAEQDFSEKFAAVDKKFADFESKFEENSKTIAAQFESLGKTLLSLTEHIGKQNEEIGKFAAMSPEPEEKPTNRRLEKIEKNVAAAKLVDNILNEINKQKN